MSLRGPSDRSEAHARAGSSLGGLPDPDLRRQIEELGRRLLPPAPDFGRLAVQVPDPPRLEGVEGDERAKLLALAYRGAFERAYDQQSVAFAGGRIGTKMLPTLLRAADQLEALRAAPAAWCRFAFEVWAAIPSARGRPGAAWVYSARLIVSKASWFAERRADLEVGAIILPPAGRALLEDHRGLWRELMAEAPKSREQVTAIMDRWFPGDSWERRVAAAEAEKRRLQADAVSAIAKGAVLW